MSNEAPLPTMPFEVLRDIAARNGTVRWSVSGTIEHLRLHKKGYVLARPIKQPKEHQILPHDGGYHCIEVDRDSKMPVDHPAGFVAVERSP